MRRPSSSAASWPALLLGLLLAATAAQAFVAPSALPTRTQLQRQQRQPLVMAAADGTDGKRKGWPVGRALRTFFQFNGPRLFPSRRGRQAPGDAAAAATGVAPAIGADLPLGHGIVLVTGATGGVGKRVVDLLLRKGLRVRALARNKQKALAMLSAGKEPDPATSRLEIVQADVSDAKTLAPSVFEGVVAVVACTAAIVQPKAGDTEDRARYYQGIKFYEPETVDAPEEVDYNGIVHTLAAAKKYGDLNGKKLYSCQPAFIDRWDDFANLDDVVMGGVSDSKLKLVPGAGEEGDESSGASRIAAVFDGVVSSEVGFAAGGFTSIRTRNLQPPLDLRGYEGIKLRVKGDGNTYKFILRDSEVWDGPSWSTMVDTKANEWQDIYVPFASLVPVVRTRSIPPDQRVPLALEKISAIQIMLSKFAYDGELNKNFREGEFKLVISSIEAYSPAKTPNFVYISSAGVDRVSRPGLDLEQEPPAVRMNDMLGGILTFKRKGEQAIEDSGLRYTIIRPCALTEEASNMPLLLDRGDTIKGKISRDDVALIVAEALTNPDASNLTFEVKSTVPFSQQWTEADAQSAPARDLGALIREVKGKQ